MLKELPASISFVAKSYLTPWEEADEDYTYASGFCWFSLDPDNSYNAQFVTVASMTGMAMQQKIIEKIARFVMGLVALYKVFMNRLKSVIVGKMQMYTI